MVGLPRPDDILSDKYRVEQVIGRGGMGVVVSAWHLELDHRVALKFLLPELAEHSEAAERFRREARASAKIKSEHVVRVLDVGNLDGVIPYMVMEYLDGRDLAAELQARGTLPVQECIDYVLQAIEAVAEAHALGIVHRDLKPENLFLTRGSDGTRRIKVLDFGISKNMLLGSGGRALTHTAIIIGSPFYMSPEQMRAPRTVDVRSDIWSLGAILYDLLAGRPPYLADTIPQLCTMMMEDDPRPLREFRPELHPELEKVITRCLVRDTSVRWSSVGDLAVALLPFASRFSRVHVERAGRVLKSVDIAASGLLAAPGSSLPPESNESQVAVHSGKTTAESASWDTAPKGGTPAGNRTPRGGVTPRAWENEHHRGRLGGTLAEGTRRMKLWVPLIVAGGIVAVALGGWMWSRGGSTSSAVSPSSSAVMVGAAVVPVLSAAAAAEATAPVAEVPSSPVASGSTADKMASPPETAASADSRTPPRASSAPASAQAAAPTPAAAPAPAPAPPRAAAAERPSPATGAGLTDFGGRR